MKDFKEFIKEAQEFKDSRDATEFMDKLGVMLNDKRLKSWAAETSRSTSSALTKLISAYNSFIDEIETPR